MGSHRRCWSRGGIELCLGNINLAKKQGSNSEVGRQEKKSPNEPFVSHSGDDVAGERDEGELWPRKKGPEKNGVGVAKRGTSPSAGWPDCSFWRRCGPTHFSPIFFPPQNTFGLWSVKALLHEFKQHLTAWPSSNKWRLVARLLPA